MKRRLQLSALGLTLALAGSYAGHLFAQGAPAALTVTVAVAAAVLLSG